MHQSVLDWVGNIVVNADLANKNVLEVGSYDENGSVRSMFSGPYVGVDMRDGPGVDTVCHAHTLPFPNAEFDVVISTEMLEHDAQFWLSLREMGRVLASGGWLILTARGNGFPHHAYPNDYWRFMPDSVPVLMALADCQLLGYARDPQQPGLFIAGCRHDR